MTQYLLRTECRASLATERQNRGSTSLSMDKNINVKLKFIITRNCHNVYRNIEMSKLKYYFIAIYIFEYFCSIIA